MTLVTLLEVMKNLGWINVIVQALSPCLRLLGLSKKTGILWLTAVLFGLSYGGAVIVEEAKSGNITHDELEQLQLSVGINHAIVEDPFLLLTFGLNPFWLWVPRLLAAILAVHMLKAWHAYKRKGLHQC